MQVKAPTPKAFVAGASGMLGISLCRVLRSHGFEVIGQSYGIPLGDSVDKAVTADFGVPGVASSLVKQFVPELVFNCAAMTNVDLCERQPELAFRLNSEVCREIALACAAIDSKFVMFSTDQLWKNASPFILENTPLDPPNTYSKSKMDGETASQVSGNELLIRTNFFGVATARKESAVQSVVNCLTRGQRYKGFEDVFYTPIAADLLSELVVKAVLAGLSGIYNVAGRERVSKLEFAQAVAKYFDLNVKLIDAVSVATMKLPAPRPREMSLSVSKIEKDLGIQMPDLLQSLNASK